MTNDAFYVTHQYWTEVLLECISKLLDRDQTHHDRSQDIDPSTALRFCLIKGQSFLFWFGVQYFHWDTPITANSTPLIKSQPWKTCCLHDFKIDYSKVFGMNSNVIALKIFG